MDKKWMVLIGLLSVLTLISSIASSSLVFFNDEAQTEANSNKVLASNNIYKNVSINYEGNNKVKLNSIEPGYNITQKFSINNSSNTNIKYNIEWFDVNSTWKNGKPEEFTYTLTCTNGSTITKQMPLNNNNNIILENVELSSNSSNDCTIKIDFKKTNEDQSYNLNKTFEGKYKVIVIE